MRGKTENEQKDKIKWKKISGRNQQKFMIGKSLGKGFVPIANLRFLNLNFYFGK